jgi:signal transduction histidine kinase
MKTIDRDFLDKKASPEAGKLKSQAQPFSARQAHFSLSNLSIKHRLPLLIGIVLSAVIIASIWASYRSVKESALELGGERLQNVCQQMANMLQQSANAVSGKTFASTNDPTITAFLHTPSPATQAGVSAVLRQFTAPQDPTNLQVEVRNARHELVLALPDGATSQTADLDRELTQCATEPFRTVGAIRLVKDTLAYPVIAAVKDNNQLIGYLIRWRKATATPDSLKQLTDLLGNEAALYFGNNQGDLWTDLVKVVPQPPPDLRSTQAITHYKRNGTSFMALGRPINGTAWFIVVEFPEHVFLSQADRFLRRMVMIGIILLVVGVAGAIVLSRSITRPLHSLMQAASAISDGDYSRMVDSDRSDELGTLAKAFNTMAIKVRNSQRNLEHLVQERTEQLEAANKELEAFSYSVSHDLRAPLRAVNGFSQIALNKFGSQLPADGQRYLQTIHNSAQQMGTLIDDLLNFSRLSRQPLNKQAVNNSRLVQSALNDLQAEQQGRAVEVRVGELPACEGDANLLKQVWINLISNALKYSRGRNPAIIEIGCSTESGEPVYFVRDNGAGFEMQYAHKLFGVFQRLHRAEDFEGTGVGLAIVQRIIHRHGGRIWAKAEPDKEAIFYFALGNQSSESSAQI